MKRLAFVLILAAVLFVPAFAEASVGLEYASEMLSGFDADEASALSWENDVTASIGFEFGMYGLGFVVYDEFITEYDMATTVTLGNTFGLELDNSFAISDPFSMYLNIPVEFASSAPVAVLVMPTLGFTGSIAGLYYEVYDELDLGFTTDAADAVVTTIGMLVSANVGYDISLGETASLNLDGLYELEIADFSAVAATHNIEIYANLGLGDFTPNVGFLMGVDGSATTVSIDMGIDYGKDIWTVGAGFTTGSTFDGGSKSNASEICIEFGLSI